MRSPSSYLKHFRLKRFPFRQQPDPEVFFAEAGRGEILRNICADIAGGKKLVRLTGGEGTGKTLLYLLLARKLDIKKFKVVCLDHPVGSFEDLLLIVCRSLNDGRDLEPDDEQAVPPRTGHLPELLALLEERNRIGNRVVLLIDEAEQLFMATLERLVRLLADIGQAKLLLQIVMIGRPELDRNLQQLSSYCDHVDIHPGYSLAPFSLQETEKYLCFRLVEAGGVAGKVREIFSEGAISALYQAAKGNLSLTNLLAEQGLIRAFESGMFQVGADQVSPRQERVRRSSPDLSPLKTWLQKYRLTVLGGSLLALALLLVFFRPEGEEPDPALPPVEQGAGEEKNQPAAEIAEKEETVTKAAEKKVPVNQPSPTEQPAPPPVPTTSAVASAGADLRPAVSNSRQEGPAPAGSQAGDVAGREAVTPSAPQELPAPLPEPAVAEPPPGSPAGGEKTAAEAPPPAEKNMVVLQADDRKRKVAGTAKETVRPAGKGEKDPEQVFAERLRASAKWRSRSGYTIQLMALASETAEENFKGLLAQKRYAGIQDKLYVIHKRVPPTLFVFYGFFETMEKARQERDRLPDFLRKNQPYPLTIDQASKKAME